MVRVCLGVILKRDLKALSYKNNVFDRFFKTI